MLLDFDRGFLTLLVGHERSRAANSRSLLVGTSAFDARTRGLGRELKAL